MIKRNPKNQNSLNLFLNNYFSVFIVIIVIFVFILSYFLFLRPKFNQTLSAIKDNIETQQKLYEAQQRKLSSLKTVSELYKKIDKNDLKKFNGVLSENYVKERLFGELEEIITANGFVPSSIKISRPEEGTDSGQAAAEEEATVARQLSPRLGQINVSVAITTIDYAGFKNLLKIFENNLRLFDLLKLNFSPSSGAADLTLATYYYKKNNP